MCCVGGQPVHGGPLCGGADMGTGEQAQYRALAPASFPTDGRRAPRSATCNCHREPAASTSAKLRRPAKDCGALGALGYYMEASSAMDQIVAPVSVMTSPAQRLARR